jgi:hypothetical protein
MDTAATLALLLDRVIDGADGRTGHKTTSAILDEAARFADAGWREAALLINCSAATTSTPRSTRSSPRRILP